VSAIIPAYNAETYLAESLDSALAQTYPNLEVVVTNDGSTDGTADILRRYGDRIKVVHQSNQGLPAARNAGIAAARGQWLAFLDSDDLWDPEKIQRQAEHFRDGVDVVHSDCRVMDGHGEVTHAVFPRAITPVECVPSNLLRHNMVFVLTAVVRRTAHKAVGGFDERARRGCEDWQLWLKLAARKAVFHHVPQPLASYRVHGSNMSGDALRMFEARLYVLRAFRRDWAGYLTPFERALLQRRLYETSFQLGYGLYHQRRYAEAHRAFRQACRAKPLRPISWAYAILTALPEPDGLARTLRRIRHTAVVRTVLPSGEQTREL